MKKKFVHTESFLHLDAKKRLVEWLRFLDENSDGCSLYPFHWQSNYGVFEELPFYETSHPYYFEQSKGLLDRQYYNIENKTYDEKKWFESSYNRGKYLFVPDITIFHKGCAKILIEIVYTNPPSEEKVKTIEKFFDGQVDLYTVEAMDIMRKSEVPKSLLTNQILKH